ncbi:methyltransferase domain-containing protein [Dactylosporangium roseum]|uniref:Methyltransferase domain-containing protein n=1 Tax=Dactylosporangium roseum TaxID=47989 RepID=A0ABY5Z1V6_9ACTN|nr:class I SAM-dependent methyltransferase [Dactylosporangium roseum]UWZ36008.1 methyltransferase domain-containing protein [Dactylosporangium roseum]
METDYVLAFGTPPGRQALEAAAGLSGGDPLAAASALRARGVPPALAAAALTQTALRRRATGKFGADAAVMLFTRAGLEQATRAPVANRRAHRLAAAGVRSVADLGCGIGADTIAFARAGLRVHAVDASPVTARIAEANVHALDLSGVVRVEARDATEVSLDEVDAVFCDPARRTSGGRRVFDPRAYSPPWEFVAGLAARVPHTVLKLAPGIDHDLLPDGAEGEWVSVDGDVVEATVWCGSLAEAPRRATLFRGSSVHGLTGSGLAKAPVGPIGGYLYDPDGAVVRAHLVAEFAAGLDPAARLADPTIAYVFADTLADTPFARRYEVLDRLPIALKKLRAALRSLDVGTLTVLKRGSALDVEELRRSLRLSGTRPAVLALTRVAGEPAALLLRAVDAPAAAGG